MDVGLNGGGVECPTVDATISQYWRKRRAVGATTGLFEIDVRIQIWGCASRLG